MKGVEQGCYASWRWMYYLTINNMTYDEIDEAVKNGKIKVGSKPPNAEITGPADEDPSKAGPTIVAGSGASTCWAAVADKPDTTKKENQP